MDFIDTIDAAPLHEIEGLTAYLKSRISPPTSITLDRYAALDLPQRRRYDAARLDYLEGNVLIRTPQVTKALTTMESMVRKNGRRADVVRPGLIISGDGSMGKTTITKTLMRTVFDAYSAQFPDFEKDSRHPVVYIEVPAGSTGKLLMVAFARCLGLTVATRDTQDTLMVRVSTALKAARTQLIVVDELQNLSAANRGNGESIQVLRQLHSWIPAIFVFSGVNLREGNLFSGPAGRQLSGRFTLHELDRFSLTTPTDKKVWNALIRAFEKTSLLFAHETGMLAPLSEHLHTLSGGSIATLGKMLTGCARDLIDRGDPGNETITQTVIDAQPRDMSAENFERTTVIRKRTTTKKGA